jgi:hypothetical protein
MKGVRLARGEISIQLDDFSYEDNVTVIIKVGEQTIESTMSRLIAGSYFDYIRNSFGLEEVKEKKQDSQSS